MTVGRTQASRGPRVQVGAPIATARSEGAASTAALPALRGAQHRPTAGGALDGTPGPSAGAGQRYGHALRAFRNLAAAGVALGLLAGCGATLKSATPEPFVIDVNVDVRDGEVVRVETQTRGEDPWSAQLRLGFSEIARQGFFGMPRAAFAHYAGDDGRWGAEELGGMLAELEIGTPPFRQSLIDLLLDRHDGDGDGRLTYAEFQGVLQPTG